MINLSQKNLIEPIGVLDSGVGGLSVLAQLYKLMPDKNYIFFGDTKNLPYGTKTPEQIFEYTKEIFEFFISKNVKNVVIACNTTSAVAYEELNKRFMNKLKIYPLIQFAAKYAVQNLKNNDTIAVLATKATVNSKKYTQEIKKINPAVNVVEIDCTGFVEIVENRLYEDIESIKFIESKLKIADQYNAKRIILGCTHYPYLVNIFNKIYECEYFNPAICVANIVKQEIKTPDYKDSKIDFYVSKAPSEFKLSAKTFFDIKDEIKIIDFSKNLI